MAICIFTLIWHVGKIQLRYRKGMANYNATNFDEDILKKYKRGYFIEWRIADKHKAERF